MQAELLTYFYPERLADDVAAIAQVNAHAEARVGSMLDLLDKAVADSGGPFLLGNRYSAVDPYLLMLSRWTRMMHHPARNRPHLGPYLRSLLERPAIQRAFQQEGLADPLI
ncbi:MAG TPA: glutathione S-transferase C-terminal domain-containing protein [Noviherbaspirillum sp.]